MKLLQDIEARRRALPDGSYARAGKFVRCFDSNASRYVMQTTSMVSSKELDGVVDFFASAPDDIDDLAALVRSVASAGCDGHPEAKPFGTDCPERYLAGKPLTADEFCWPCRIRHRLAEVER